MCTALDETLFIVILAALHAFALDWDHRGASHGGLGPIPGLGSPRGSIGVLGPKAECGCCVTTGAMLHSWLADLCS